MPAATIPGIVWGVVTDNNDPEGIGRAKILIPGLFEPEHPEWGIPLGWPGAGGLTQGSRYPVKPGDQVAVLFEHGEIDTAPLFLPGPYGGTGQTPLGPTEPADVFVEGGDPNNRAVIWENNQFSFYFSSDDDDQRAALIEKTTGSKIEFNATDGNSGRAVTLTLQANTSISIESNGIIDIDANVVQINGRKVTRKPGVTTI